jgi:hypothetical protein
MGIDARRSVRFARRSPYSSDARSLRSTEESASANKSSLREVERRRLEGVRWIREGNAGNRTGETMKTLYRGHPGRVTSGLRSLIPLAVWIEIRFEPRDAWIGAYVDDPETDWSHDCDVYLCILPFFPIIFKLRAPSFANWQRDVKRVIADRALAKEWDQG